MIPLVLLTGFLGAGKTTVINRVLGAQHHRRVAILMNELGRIDVDAGLIRSRAGDVMELTGGCVCHQIGVQRELWSALDDVVRRSKPDVVVLETTGIAEPGPILRALARRNRPRKSSYRPNAMPDSMQEDGDDWEDSSDSPADGVFVHASAVVTVVDAEAGVRQLSRHAEAREQVIAADQILISKTDLASAHDLSALHQRLHELNPRAERAAFPPDGEATAALIPWLLDAKAAPADATEPARARSHAGEHPHADARGHGSHAHQLAAATYVDDAPLIAEALLLVCERLGPRLVRAKGFVHIAGEDHRGFLERAGDRTRLEFGAAWSSEPRLTRLVLIGEDLDEAALHRQLWACRAKPN